MARADGSLRSLLARLSRIDVLVIDVWVIAPLSEAPRRKIFSFSVDGGEKLYEGQEVGETAPRVELNAPIQYSNSLYINSATKIHELSLNEDYDEGMSVS